MKGNSILIYSTIEEMFGQKKANCFSYARDFSVFSLADLSDNLARNSGRCRRSLFYCIWMISNNSLRFTVNNCSPQFTLPFTLLFTSPFHVYDITCIMPPEGYIICFSEYYVQAWFRNLEFQKDFPFFWSNENMFFIPEGTALALDQLGKKILSEFEACKTLSADIIRDYLHIFLLEAKRIVRPDKIIVDRSAEYGLFQQFLQLVNNSFPLNRSVEQMAERLRVTPAHLWMSVRKISGQSPSEIINKRILTEAQSLLAQSDLKVSEIAYQLNFKEKSHFTRFFKNLTGSSPSSFARQSRRVEFSSRH